MREPAQVGVRGPFVPANVDGDVSRYAQAQAQAVKEPLRTELRHEAGQLVEFTPNRVLKQVTGWFFKPWDRSPLLSTLRFRYNAMCAAPAAIPSPR